MCKYKTFILFIKNLLCDWGLCIVCDISDIEAQIREIQSRKKEIAEDGLTEKERVGLGESGFYDRDIYDGGGKFEGYVTSIAANDEVDVSFFYL